MRFGFGPNGEGATFFGPNNSLNVEGALDVNFDINGYKDIKAAGNMSALAFNPVSDRNDKENFEGVSSKEILERIAGLPITKWNFKQDASCKHIGPMAQDFFSAFHLGTDDKHIATVDADGVALAAIQGLHSLVKDKDAEIADLKKRLEAVEKIVLKQNGDGR